MCKTWGSRIRIKTESRIRIRHQTNSDLQHCFLGAVRWYLVPAVVVDEVFWDPVLQLYLKISMLKLKKYNASKNLITTNFFRKDRENRGSIYSISSTFE
jgi:hypothetical protein